MKEAETLYYSPTAKTKSVPAGFMFHPLSLLFFSIILFGALVQNLHSFTVIISFVLALALIAKSISLAVLAKVHCRFSLPQRNFFPLDSAVVSVEIANNKFIPLFWAHLEVPLPQGLDAEEDAGVSDRTATQGIAFDFSLNALSAAKFSPAVICRKRGYYPLKKLIITSGDLFGLYTQTMEFMNDEALVVYPRLYPIKDLDMVSLHPSGGVSFKEQLFHDHTRTMGVRDYCTGDEFRHIHWKASARRDRLQVKVFEPSTTGQLVLFLPAEEFGNNEELETAICVLAALAHSMVGQGNSVGFISNYSLMDSGGPVAVFPDSNKNKMDVLLEAFAKISSKVSESWKIFFPSILNQLRWGTTFVFAAAQFNETVCRSILSLRQAGYKVIVVHPGNRKDNPLYGEVSLYKYALLNGYIQCEPQQ